MNVCVTKTEGEMLVLGMWLTAEIILTNNEQFSHSCKTGGRREDSTGAGLAGETREN